MEFKKVYFIKFLYLRSKFDTKMLNEIVQMFSEHQQKISDSKLSIVNLNYSQTYLHRFTELND